MDDIDYELLRADLLDYFGSGFIEMPLIGQMLDQVINANNEVLLAIAVAHHFDLNKYINNNYQLR